MTTKNPDIGYLDKDQRITAIKNIIIDETGCPKEFCELKARFRPLADARHIFTYTLRKVFPQLPYSELGYVTGRRDHASAINSIKIVSNLIDLDSEKKMMVDRIIKRSMLVKGRKVISMIEMAKNFVQSFLMNGKYDHTIKEDDILYYAISIGDYVWDKPSVMEELVLYYKERDILIKYRKVNNYHYLLFSEKLFV